MKMKKWFISTSCIVLAIIILFISVMFICDPLYQYKKPSPLTYYKYNEMYSNPGIAKNWDYDTVLVGTSMIENTDNAELDKLFNCKSIKVPYSGSTSYTMNKILNVCFKHNDHIKTVLWEIDCFQLFNEYNVDRVPLPDYLYDDNIFNDVNYLFNLNIAYHYLSNDITGTLRGKKEGPPKVGPINTDLEYGKEVVLRSFSREELAKKVSDEIMIDKIMLNIDNNFIPLIKNNPNTKFILFFPPFSMLYWDNEIRNGQFKAEIEAFKEAFTKLLSYDNVTINFLAGETEITTNLDNYRDFSHYKPEINSWVINSVANNIGKITSDNLKKKMDVFYNLITSTDMDAFIGN